MSADAVPSKGNFTVVRGGLAPYEISADEWLDRETRSLFASWKANGGTGPYASRGIANVAHEINQPLRFAARRMREAHAQRVRHELVRQLGALPTEYADRLYRKQTSQPDRAA